MLKPLVILSGLVAVDALSAAQLGQKFVKDVVTTDGIFGIKHWNVWFGNDEIKDIFGNYNDSTAVNVAVLLHFVSILGVAALATQLPERWWRGFTDIIPKIKARYGRDRVLHDGFEYVDEDLYFDGAESRLRKRRRGHGGRRGRRPAWIAGRRSDEPDFDEDMAMEEPKGFLDNFLDRLLMKRSAPASESTKYMRKKAGYRPVAGATNQHPSWLTKVLNFMRFPTKTDRRDGPNSNFFIQSFNAIANMIATTFAPVSKSD